MFRAAFSSDKPYQAIYLNRNSGALQSVAIMAAKKAIPGINFFFL